MRSCPYCGKENRDQASFCGHCGGRITPIPQQRESTVRQAPNPRTATLLSFLWPGLGQIYNGQVMRGAIFCLFSLFLSTWPFFLNAGLDAGKTGEEIFSEALDPTDEPIGFFGFTFAMLLFFVPLAVFWIYGMIDAKRGAEGRAADIAVSAVARNIGRWVRRKVASFFYE